jgi:Domain of unknown function (DUF4286)
MEESKYSSLGDIVYNITRKVDPKIENDWVEWQKNENIPGIMTTGLFTEYKFYRLLEQDETEGITYVIQYYTSSLKNYHQYIDEYASQFQKKGFEKWQHQYVDFRTVMQIVN